jgi:hypothetical protein
VGKDENIAPREARDVAEEIVAEHQHETQVGSPTNGQTQE